MRYNGSEPEYDVVVDKDLMVEMRDGILLATDVYQPARSGRVVKGRLPTILQRTPYNKEASGRIRGLGEWFCKRGYVVVIQDFRGRFKSEGTFYKYANLGEDSYDTVEWIAEQPWSNGKIGTIGTSFMAHFQIALACMNPPHLSTMVVNQGGFANAYLSSCRHMGAFELRQMTWTFKAAADSKEAAANPVIKDALESINPAHYLDPTRGPLKEGQTPLRFVPSYERFYFDMLTKAEYTDYWRKIGLCAEEYYDVMSDIPILLLGGWYDSYTRTTSDLYIGLSKRKKGQIRLIFGPWIHGWQSLGSTHSGEVDFGPEAHIKGTHLAPTPNLLALRWFNHWLKGIDTGLQGEAPVKIFVMGDGDGRKNSEGRMNHGGGWRDEKEWPLARTRYKNYYLHPDGSLSTEPPGEDEPPSTYSFDPRDPVPTIGGNISSAFGTMIPGAFDQVERPDILGCKPPYLPLAQRNDILVFKTPPLREDVEITGPIRAKLWVSTSALDTDFTLKLIDLYPPNEDYPWGFAMNLSDTIFRARFYKSWENPELLKPGGIYELKMVSYPTSNLFKAGHQIRVDISSSNYPRFDVNPNSGEPLGRGRMFVVAHQKIHHDANHPSHIILPVIPTR